MTDKIEQLQKISRLRAKKRPNRITRLGDTIEQLVEKRFAPQQTRLQMVTQVWGQLLPPELGKHCRVSHISGGQLKVFVDSPVYMYELQLCSATLLSELQQKCAQSQIKKIKFVIG